MDLSFAKYLPSTALRPFINFYYVVSGNDIAFENHPQGTFDLIFGQASQGEFRGEKTVKVAESATTIFVAQQKNPFDLYFAPKTKIFGVSLKAEGLYKILHFPLQEMNNRIWDISDHISLQYKNLNEQVLESKSDKEAVQVIDSFFLKRYYIANATLVPFDKLLSFIRQYKGNLSVTEMARRMNVSSRTLNRLFYNHIGISPKAYTSIIRFQHAILNYYQHPHLGWSPNLLDAGYYDQNHFIKDFKRFTGKTPSSFLGTDRTLSDFFLKQS